MQDAGCMVQGARRKMQEGACGRWGARRTTRTGFGFESAIRVGVRVRVRGRTHACLHVVFGFPTVRPRQTVAGMHDVHALRTTIDAGGCVVAARRACGGGGDDGGHDDHTEHLRGQRQRDGRLWAGTRAPPQPLFDIQASEGFSSWPQRATLSREQAGGHLGRWVAARDAASHGYFAPAAARMPRSPLPSARGRASASTTAGAATRQVGRAYRAPPSAGSRMQHDAAGCSRMQHDGELDTYGYTPGTHGCRPPAAASTRRAAQAGMHHHEDRHHARC